MTTTKARKMPKSKVYSGQVARRAKSQPHPRVVRYFFVGLKPKVSLRELHTYECQRIDDWEFMFANAAGNSIWVCASNAETLLKAASHTVRRHSLGDLVLLESPKIESLPPLQAIFRKVVG